MDDGDGSTAAHSVMALTKVDHLPVALLPVRSVLYTAAWCDLEIVYEAKTISVTQIGSSKQLNS